MIRRFMNRTLMGAAFAAIPVPANAARDLIASIPAGPRNVAKLYRALDRMGVQIGELRRAGQLMPGSDTPRRAILWVSVGWRETPGTPGKSLSWTFALSARSFAARGGIDGPGDSARHPIVAADLKSRVCLALNVLDTALVHEAVLLYSPKAETLLSALAVATATAASYDQATQWRFVSAQSESIAALIKGGAIAVRPPDADAASFKHIVFKREALFCAHRSDG